MPASVVKTPRDERLWSEAKKQAADQGREGDYKYIMGIFMRMKERKGGADPKTAAGTLRKASEIGAHELFAAIKRGGLKSSTEQRKGIDVSGKNLSAPDRYALAGVVVTHTPATAKPNLRITGMAKAVGSTKYTMAPKAPIPRPGSVNKPTTSTPNEPRAFYTKESQPRSLLAKACVIRKAGDGGKHSKCASCKMGKACKADMLKQSMAEYGTKAVGSAKHTVAPSAPTPSPRTRGTQFAGRGGYEAQARAKPAHTTGRAPNPLRPSSSVAVKPNPGARTWLKKSLLADGESLDEFHNELNSALEAKFGSRSYAREVYKDRVIFDVLPSKLGMARTGGRKRRYYSVGYTRETDGAFKFGKKVEVEQRTTYPPMSKSLLDSNLAKLGPVRIKAQTFADFFVRS